jgi:hypothetical protein
MVQPGIYWDIKNELNDKSSLFNFSNETWVGNSAYEKYNIAIKLSKSLFANEFESVRINAALTEAGISNTSSGSLLGTSSDSSLGINATSGAQSVWLYIGNVTASVYKAISSNIDPLIIEQRSKLDSTTTMFSAFDYNKMNMTYDMVTDCDWLSANGDINSNQFHSLIGSGARFAYGQDWDTLSLSSKNVNNINSSIMYNGLTSTAAHAGIDIDTFRTIVSENYTAKNIVETHAYVTSLMRGHKGVFYGFQPNAMISSGSDDDKYSDYKAYGWYYFCVQNLFDYIKLPTNIFGTNITMEVLTNNGWVPVSTKMCSKGHVNLLVPNQFTFVDGKPLEFEKQVEYKQYLPYLPNNIKRFGPPFGSYPQEFGYIMSNTAFYPLLNTGSSNPSTWSEGSPTWGSNVLDWTVRPIGGYWFRLLTNIGREYSTKGNNTIDSSIIENDIFGEFGETLSKIDAEKGTLKDHVDKTIILNLLHNTPPMFVNIVKNECWIEDASIDGSTLRLLVAGTINGTTRMEVHTIDVS